MMNYIFSDEGEVALSNFVDDKTLLAFDIDGTLAPIVSDPAKIVIPYETSAQLSCLNQLAPVAIVTGRSCDEARKFLKFKPGFLVGNHGAEGLPGRKTYEKEFYNLCDGWLRQIEILMPNAKEIGIEIENKGTTLSLHYRNSLYPESSVEKIVELIRQLEPAPRRVSGIYVENIVPNNAPDKGEALLHIMRQVCYSKALYVGDDTTDESVFKQYNENILGIRVGFETSSMADYFLFDHTEINRLLYRITQLILTG